MHILGSIAIVFLSFRNSKLERKDSLYVCFTRFFFLPSPKTLAAVPTSPTWCTCTPTKRLICLKHSLVPGYAFKSRHATCLAGVTGGLAGIMGRVGQVQRRGVFTGSFDLFGAGKKDYYAWGSVLSRLSSSTNSPIPLHLFVILGQNSPSDEAGITTFYDLNDHRKKKLIFNFQQMNW